MSLTPTWFTRALLMTTVLVAPSIAAAQETAPANAGDAPAGEIVVRGRFIPEPMRQTSEVATFLSADDLARQGDDNAASALTRLTGLSVVSGKFVYVRGLGDRYSSALLNGSPLPSPEPLRRQVPLDLFPSNILDGATVQKTFSPNFPGEFGGGVIDLRTVKLPSEPFFTVKLGTGLNTESSLEKGLTYYGERNDWTGVGGSDRDRPAALEQALARKQRIQTGAFSDADLERIGESLVNSNLYVLQREKTSPDFEGEVTAGTSIDFGKYNIGLIGVGGYDSSMRNQNAVRNRPAESGSPNTRSQSSTWDIVANLFGSASLGWDGNEIAATALLVRSTTKDAQTETGTNTNLPTGQSEREESSAWYERQLASFQLEGDHELDRLKVEWRGAFAQSKRDAPYERGVTLAVVNNTALFTQSGQNNYIRFSELTDEVISGGVDATYTLDLDDRRELKLSGGVATSNTVREYEQLSFSFVAQGPVPRDVATARVDFLFSKDNIDPRRFVLEETTGADDSYKGRLTVQSAYLAADAELTGFLRAAIGARYEDGSQIVRTTNRFGAVTTPGVTIEEQYLLPAATLTWNFAEDLQMRFGYSQTIARPQFRELAFTPYIDPETDRNYQGNPFLVDSEFKNYDARVEYYFGRNQFVTGAAFYKTIDNPIEEVAIRSGERSLTRFFNAPEATLYGAELEYRTNFELPFKAPFLSDATWLFAANYTYTFSEVTADSGARVIDATQLPSRVLVPAANFRIDGSKLQGTPENIFNLQFGYETVNSQLTLLAGWVDERVAQRGLGQPNVIEDPGVNLDLVYRRDMKVGGTDLTLSVSGRNLLDEDQVEFQNNPGIGRTDYNTFARGQTFSISLTAKY